MRYLLLISIEIFWKLVPESKRPKCLYKTTCSRKIYTVTKDHGFIEGLKIALYRFKTCRPGYSLFENPVTGKKQMLLADNSILPEELIAERYLKKQFE
ncbi:membrane protein insertion efficiency factor YidD [Gillisia sp. Hel_I_29]|uniref:membrane protein insertion efficiency factor YidD n=1 Tax=Gillisia sp. Hel_I_29 TaxID=1249975 RepID=UPI00054D2190|nr:membrane protein insertion efficiency factor YidD [Gillisia sp. Hel_I_29]